MLRSDTVNYTFPDNLTIEEVRSVVDAHNAALGTKAFIEADRGDHVIFNYVVAFEGSFPAPSTGDPAVDRARAILRECRGLTFCKQSGGVLNRKFQKFFNINEKPETQIGAIDWSQPHVVLEKLDGSMVTPLPVGNRLSPDHTIRWATKMGLTDIGGQIDRFVAEHPNYERYAFDAFAAGLTAIFEWCSRKQKIVVDYPVDRLVLTAVRDNDTGRYLSYDDLLWIGEHYGIEVVRALPGNARNIQQFMAEAQDLEGAEGYVIRFADGHMVKVKGAWYVAIHKTKDMIQSEKAVWELILDDRVDDAKAFMDAPDRDRVGRFHDAFERALILKASDLNAEVASAKLRLCGDKKAFATEFMPTVEPLVRPLLFSIWDGHDPEAVVRAHLRKHTGSGPRLEIVRPLIDGVRWEDYRDKSYHDDN